MAALHQAGLELGGLRRFVEESPRVGFVSANKEGIVSIPGYYSLFLLGAATGNAGTVTSVSSCPLLLARFRQHYLHSAVPCGLHHAARLLCAVQFLFFPVFFLFFSSLVCFFV